MSTNRMEALGEAFAPASFALGNAAGALFLANLALKNSDNSLGVVCAVVAAACTLTATFYASKAIRRYRVSRILHDYKVEQEGQTSDPS